MPAFRKQLCAVVLLVLISETLSKPHTRRKRSLVKDYFDPLGYPSLQFEKGEDGKYHPHPDNSQVEYVLAGDMDSKNEIIEENSKDTGSEAKPKSSDFSEAEKKNDFSLIESTETEKELVPVDSKLPVLAKSDHESTELVDADKFSVIAVNEDSKLDSEVKSEVEKENIDENTKIDVSEHKFTLMPKPDSKDEKPYEGQFTPDEYGPLSDGSEKEAKGKLAIGQIPILLPPFLPHGIQMLLRPRHFHIGEVPMMPVPPAVHISDRLPIADADVIEEGSETAVIEDVETGDTLIKGMRRVSANHYNNPMGIGIPLPMMPFHRILKEITGEVKLDGDTKSEILDVNGKKMLLQKKILKYPGDDNSKLYLRVMSMHPLEHVDPEVLKELDLEKEAKDVGYEEKESKEVEDSLKKTLSENDKDVGIKVAKDIPVEEAVNVHKVHEEIEKEEKEDKSLISKEEAEKDLAKEVKPLKTEKLFPQSDILKVEETKVSEQVFTEVEDKLKDAKLGIESKDLDFSKTIAESEKPNSLNKAEEENEKTVLDNTKKDIDLAIQTHESDEAISKTLQTDELLETKDVDQSQIEADEEKYKLDVPKEFGFGDTIGQSDKTLATRNMLTEAKSTEENIEATATQIKNKIADEENTDKEKSEEDEIHKESDGEKGFEEKDIKIEDIDLIKREDFYEEKKKVISDEKEKKVLKKGKKEKKCKCEKDKDSGSDSEDED